MEKSNKRFLFAMTIITMLIMDISNLPKNNYNVEKRIRETEIITPQTMPMSRYMATIDSIKRKVYGQKKVDGFIQTVVVNEVTIGWAVLTKDICENVSVDIDFIITMNCETEKKNHIKVCGFEVKAETGTPVIGKQTCDQNFYINRLSAGHYGLHDGGIEDCILMVTIDILETCK